MNIQEFKTKVISSTLSAEKKEKILALLSVDVTVDIIEQVKDLIQEDIDTDTVSLLTTDDDKKSLAEAQAKLSTDLSKVEKDLEEDMKFVENEMKEIDNTVQNLNSAIDQSKIDAINVALAN